MESKRHRRWRHGEGAGIAQARLIEYDGVSHGLLVTGRDRVTRDLLEFLRA